jgi:hypothetical protein
MIPPVTYLIYLSQALAPRATPLNDFEFDGDVPTMHHDDQDGIAIVRALFAAT